jgi:hypothetical protein
MRSVRIPLPILTSIGICRRFTGFGICYATKDLPRTEKTACRRSAMLGIVADEFELGGAAGDGEDHGGVGRRRYGRVGR